METISSTQTCWCSDRELVEFSPDYSRCLQCGTLILTKGLTLDEVRVTDDDRDFYSKEYWLSYQTEEYGYPDIRQRSRQDMPERCLYWLQTLMRYKLAPGKVLELGCSHGGSVALVEWAGFDATGLELSPWVVDFATKTFDIPMLLGPLEDRQIAPASLDAIVLYDVLEHLPDPISTIRHAASLLKDDGIFIIQTPNYIEGKTYLELVTTEDRFLEQLKPNEHIYLFNQRAIAKFFRSVGFDFLQFEPQLFDYDMYFAVSRHPLVRNTDEQIAHNLAKRSSGRMVLALIDSAAALAQSQQERQYLQAQLSAAQQQVEQSQHQVIQLQAQLDRNAELAAAQRQLHESGQQQLAQLQSQTHESHQQQLAQLQAQIERSQQQESERLATAESQVQQVRLQQLHHQIQEAEALVETTNAEIASMKTTKFWQLRIYWFKFKQIVGWQSSSRSGGW